MYFDPCATVAGAFSHDNDHADDASSEQRANVSPNVRGRRSEENNYQFEEASQTTKNRQEAPPCPTQENNCNKERDQASLGALSYKYGLLAAATGEREKKAKATAKAANARARQTKSRAKNAPS